MTTSGIPEGEVLDCLHEHGTLTVPELVSLTGRHEDTIKYALYGLKDVRGVETAGHEGHFTLWRLTREMLS